MIQINQLYIDHKKHSLIIDAQIIESPLYENITFDYIAINNKETYVKNGIGENSRILHYGSTQLLSDYTVYKIGDDVVSEGSLFVYVLSQVDEGKENKLIVGNYIWEDRYKTLYKIKSVVGGTLYLEEDSDNEALYRYCNLSEDWDKYTFRRLIIENENNTRHVHREVPIKSSGPLLFITFVAKGEISTSAMASLGLTDLPCTWDENVITEVVCDMSNIHQSALNYIGEMSNSCSIPNGFIDFILQYNMLKACLASGAYNEAIKYWDKLYNTKTICSPCVQPQPCGCYG